MSGHPGDFYNPRSHEFSVFEAPKINSAGRIKI